MKSLVGISPHTALLHGPSKTLVDTFLWHNPDIGIIASYTPKERDTHDHFGVYRASDQMESFGLASVVAANAFLSCRKKNISFKELYVNYNFIFMKIEEIICKSFIKLGETLVIYAYFEDYKFRQMTASGKIFKTNTEFDLQEYYKSYTDKQFLAGKIDKSFVEVTELKNLVGRGIKINKI